MNKKGTYKTRQDFIETDYVNGVYDKDGNMVIRPLNDAEKEYLAQYIAETEHGSFSSNRELKKQTKVYKAMVDMYKKTQKRLKDLHKKIQKQKKLVLDLREASNCFYVDDKDRHDIFNKDNARRVDIFNILKMQDPDNLVYYDLNEYDEYLASTRDDCVESIYLNRDKISKD